MLPHRARRSARTCPFSLLPSISQSLNGTQRGRLYVCSPRPIFTRTTGSRGSYAYCKSKRICLVLWMIVVTVVCDSLWNKKLAALLKCTWCVRERSAWRATKRWELRHPPRTPPWRTTSSSGGATSLEMATRNSAVSTDLILHFEIVQY